MRVSGELVFEGKGLEPSCVRMSDLANKEVSKGNKGTGEGHTAVSRSLNATESSTGDTPGRFVTNSAHLISVS